MQISKQKINKIQCNSILALRGSQKGLIITCKILKNIMWPSISFIITKGFRSTILENENHVVNGGHIHCKNFFISMSLKNHSNNSSPVLYWLEYLPYYSYFILLFGLANSYFSLKIPTFSYFLDHSTTWWPVRGMQWFCKRFMTVSWKVHNGSMRGSLGVSTGSYYPPQTPTKLDKYFWW